MIEVRKTTAFGVVRVKNFSNALEISSIHVLRLSHEVTAFTIDQSVSTLNVPISIQLHCLFNIYFQSRQPSPSTAHPFCTTKPHPPTPAHSPSSILLPGSQLPNNQLSIPLRKRSIPRPRQSLLMRLPRPFMSMQSIPLP